ncbi:MAG: class I SAM-dependent methyltransferase [Gemmatimonadales bacterium]|nr:class I SAM-dependent methyltransferase [Gemmatimonadales bacterium]
MTLPALVRESAAAPGVPAPREATCCLACGAREQVEVARSRTQMAPPTEEFRWVACARCGLVFLNPRVPGAQIDRYYRDYVPHRGPGAWGRWASLVRVSEERVDRARLATVRRLGPLGPAQSVLDVGCGRPSFLRRLVHQSGARGVGTDFDASGWSHDPAIGVGLELHAGILEELPLAGPFDRITLWQVLEHLYDPVATLRFLRGLAGPATRLVIEVPDHAGLTRRRHGAAWAGYHTPRHTAAYTPRTLRRLLEAAGWRVERQYQWGTLDPYLLHWLSRQERAGRDWSAPLEGSFVPFLLGRMLWTPLGLLERWVPLGFQTAIAAA